MHQQLTETDPRTLGLRLQEARKARDLTQQEVADHLGMARTTVTAIEKGERLVQPAELLRFSALFGRAVHDLLRQREPLTSFTVQFRTSLNQPGLDGPEVSNVIAEFQQLSEDYIELEELRDAPLSQRYPPPYDFSDVPAEQAAEDVATAERNRLGLGDGPIPNLKEVLENDVGIRIFCLKMPSKVAALLGYTDRVGGCVAINAGHPPERHRWSLAHEYAHFMTRRYQADVMVLSAYRRVPESERFADAFAKFFLMPSTGLLRRFNELRRARQGTITPAELVKLAHFYNISFEALVRHLEGQRMLSTGTFEDLIDRGFKVREAQQILQLPPGQASWDMLPLRYQLLAAEAFQKAQITEGQFAHFLRLDRLSARQLYQSLSRNPTLSDEGMVGEIGLNLGEAIASQRA